MALAIGKLSSRRRNFYKQDLIKLMSRNRLPTGCKAGKNNRVLNISQEIDYAKIGESSWGVSNVVMCNLKKTSQTLLWVEHC